MLDKCKNNNKVNDLLSKVEEFVIIFLKNIFFCLFHCSAFTLMKTCYCLLSPH